MKLCPLNKLVFNYLTQCGVFAFLDAFRTILGFPGDFNSIYGLPSVTFKPTNKGKKSWK